MSVLRDRRVAVLLVLVLAGSVLSVVLALTRPDVAGVGEPPSLTEGTSQGYRSADLVGPGGEALAAAVAAVPLAYSYDHRRLDASLKAATARMSARYRPAFTRDFDRKRRAVVREKVVARGVVRGAGVVRANGDDAVVCLLYVDEVLAQVRGRKRGADPQVLSRRVRVAMVLAGGAWKIDGITQL